MWEAAVPADMEDGQYVVELFALDDKGNQAYWTGILYISTSNRNITVRLVADKFKIWLLSDAEDQW